MPHPCPHHCPRSGGGGAAALVVLVLVVVIAAAARPVVRAAETVLEVAAIVTGSIAALAVLAGVAYAAIRVRRHQANRRAISRHARTPQALSAPQARAIEAPRPPASRAQHLTGLKGLKSPAPVSQAQSSVFSVQPKDLPLQGKIL